MIARRPALALLVLVGCDPAPSQPAAAAREPAPLMESTRAELDTQASRASAASQPSAAPRHTPTVESTPALTPTQAFAYERKAWPHWIDADRDCQDARTEVLIRDAYEPVSFEDTRECEVAGGAWQCPYTGKIIKQAHLLDVDHLVPLANAHRSGGDTWSVDRRRLYANDLDHPAHLIAVDYVANRSKGDKGPEAWLPPSEDYRCTYVREWTQIKQRWQLRMSPAEAAAVDDALALCEAGRVPPLPQARGKGEGKPQAKQGAKQEAPSQAGDSKGSAPAATSSPSERSCCRTCKQGKACGDSCISRTLTCSKPPGCACDG